MGIDVRRQGATCVPYGPGIIKNRVTCVRRDDRLFCSLPLAAVQHLSAITPASSCPKGTTLFVERQAARGVLILCAGRVKLSTSSAYGKTLIIRISDPGEVLGLPATITATLYELTAEVLEPAQVNFIARTDFLSFLRENGEVGLRVAQQLSETYHVAIAAMRSIGLSHSAGEKLARFLLDLCADHGDGNGEIRVTLALTHEEIAQMIGASRETVNRLFAEFKKNNCCKRMARRLLSATRWAPGLGAKLSVLCRG